MKDDYKELNLHLDMLEEDTIVNLYVYFANDEMYVFNDVKNNPCRYQGFWAIKHNLMDKVTTAYVEDTKVKFFKTTEYIQQQKLR